LREKKGGLAKRREEKGKKGKSLCSNSKTAVDDRKDVLRGGTQRDSMKP